MFFFKNTFLTLFVCCFGIASVHAETLEVAVEKTLQTHPSVQAAQAALENALEKKREERSGYFPEIAVNTTFGRIFGNNSTTRGLVTDRGEAYSYLGEAGISARQMIFDGYETSRRLDAAKARKLAAEQTVTDVLETLSFTTVQSYIDLLRAHKALTIIRAQKAQAQDYHDRIESALNDGASDESELQQAKEVLLLLNGFLIEYEGQKAALESQYIELTGSKPETALENPTPYLEAGFEDVEEAVAYAKLHHPSILAAKMSAKSSLFDIDVEKASLYPNIGGELSYLESDKKEEIGGELTDAKAVLRMNWNFETGRGQYARIAQKKASRQQALARLAEIERQIERGVRLAYAEYDTALKSLKNETNKSQLSEDLFETYQTQFEGALIRVIDLMQADNQYFSARLAQTNAAHRALLSQYALLASVGRLGASLNLSAQPGP